MHRVLFRIGALLTAIVVGGTALAAANGTDAAVRTLTVTQVTDSGPCIIVNGVWYCWELADNQS